MYQSHPPIRIDKGRPLSANTGPGSSSHHGSFHKIYRQRRCYSTVDKEQEGHSSSQWRSGVVNSQRENNAGLQSHHTVGPSDRIPTRRVVSKQSVKSSSYSAALPNIRRVKSNRQHLKRPTNDRLAWNSASELEFDTWNSASGPDYDAWNSASGPEFEAPVVKKQKAEHYKPSPPQHIVSPETKPGKQKMAENYKPSALQHIVFPETKHRCEQKMVLDDTKWMYKNQHAKMSGPYGVKQLMEGLHARFLQEDLPIYQVLEGKLCPPIELRQLADDLHGCNALSHSPGRRSCSGQRFSQGASKGMPSKIAKDADLPPGFGGPSVQHLEGPSCIYMPSSTALAAGPKGSAGVFTSSVPDFGDTGFCLPPGFEAGAATASPTEPHITEMSGSSRRLSTGAGVAVRSDGVRGIHLNYEKLDPIRHDQGHSSQHVSVSHSKVSPTMPGAKILTENSSWHTAWAYTPSTTRVLNYEAPAFPPPTVCIGLPVSKPAVQNWPVTNISLSAEPYCILDAYAQGNNGFVHKEDSGYSVRHGPDSLTLIQLELLAAVKRTYAKSVLRAVIGEQLECWIDCRNTMGKSGLVEKGSLSREICCLSSGEVDFMSVEANTSQVKASTAPANYHIGAAESSLEVMAALCSDGSCLKSLSAHPEEYQCPSAEASGMRKRFNTHTSNTVVDASLPSNTEENGLEVSSMRNNGNTYTSDTVVNASMPSNTEENRLEASSMRNSGNTHTSDTVLEASLLSNTEENGLHTSRAFPFIGKAEEMPHYLEKAESCLSVDKASKLSLKSSSLVGNDFKQVVSDLREEVQCQSVVEILHDDASEDKFQSSGNSSDAVVLEAKPPFHMSGTKKGNVKSLKQLMLIALKLRSKHPKKSLLMNRKRKSSSRKGVEDEERSLQDEMPISKDYDGCARTSFDGWFWRNQARHAHSLESFQERDCSTGVNGSKSFRSIRSNVQTARTNRAQLQELAAGAKGSDVLRLTQSKVPTTKLIFARSKIHDWGVFAAEPVEAGDFVIEYIGELVRSRISDIRERHYEKLGIGGAYLFRIDDETVVDATKRGGLARFINHSCDPNCSTKIITVEGSKKIYIYAKRHIEAGEELTYDYRFFHEGQKVPCNCGSTGCRGSLN
eukprot:c21500_g1_i1 orf=589-3957(-)